MRRLHMQVPIGLKKVARFFTHRQPHFSWWKVVVALALATCAISASGAEANRPEIAGPLFSVPAGVYTNKVRVELTAPTAAVIHFSFDGNDPENDSAIYTGAIEITNCTIVRARAGYADGRISPTV